MRLFNRVLATIISIALIAGSAIGIAYLVGLLTNVPELMQLARGGYQSLIGLTQPQLQALLLGIFAIGVVLFILEVRPWKQEDLIVRDDEHGVTLIPRSDIERFLSQRLARERAITPESVEVIARGARFDVASGVAVSSDANRQEVRSKVEADIKDDLDDIGLNEDLDRISTRVSRVKRVA